MSRYLSRKTLVGLTLAFGVAVATTAQAQAPTGLVARGGNFFGVMGEVNRTGVYEFTEASPLLVDVIRQAGGLTRFANQNVRIVRGGRAGHQAFVTPSTDFMLLPGDIIIADSAQRRSTRDDEQIGDVNHLPPVSIGLVGVLERPVVLTVKGPQATLGGLLQFLGQPTSIVSRARVIGASRSSRNSPAIGSTTRLSESAVVVLNARDVERRRVPALPPAFQRVSIAAMNSQPQYPGRFEALPNPQPQPVPYPVAQPQPSYIPYHPQPLSASAIPTLLPTPNEVESENDSPPGRAGITDSVPGRTYLGAVDGNQNRVYRPVPGQIRPETVIPLPTGVAVDPPTTIVSTQPSLTNGSPIQTASDETATVNESSGPELSKDAPAAVVPTAEEPAATTPEKPHSDVPMIVLYLAMVGLLVIGVLLLAMVRTEPPTKHTTVAVPKAAKRELLERLIRNELPILEEPPQMPTKLEFFGKANSRHTLRMDAPHATLAGPHFNRRPFVREPVASGAPNQLPSQQQSVVRAPREPAAAATEATSDTGRPTSAKRTAAKPTAAKPSTTAKPGEKETAAKPSKRRESSDTKRTATEVKTDGTDDEASTRPRQNSPELPEAAVESAPSGVDPKLYDAWLADFRRTRSTRSQTQLSQLGNVLKSSDVAGKKTDIPAVAPATKKQSSDPKPSRWHRVDSLHADFDLSQTPDRQTKPSFAEKTELENVEQPSWTDDSPRAETGVLERVLMSVHGSSDRDDE